MLYFIIITGYYITPPHQLIQKIFFTEAEAEKYIKEWIKSECEAPDHVYYTIFQGNPIINKN